MPIRIGGASRGAPEPATRATTSAPKPPVTFASCTTASRPVRQTLPSTASVSNGLSHGVSSTSASIPSPASAPAAASTCPVIAPQVTTVTSEPGRRVRAPPIGRTGPPVSTGSLPPK